MNEVTPALWRKIQGLVWVLCFDGSAWLNVMGMFKRFTWQSLGLSGLLIDTLIVLHWVLGVWEKIVLAAIHLFTSVC